MKCIATLSVIAFTGIAQAGAREIRLNDCPPAVQATIRENMREGKLDEIEAYTLQGKSLYVAEVELPEDRDLKVHVAADGALIKTREDSSLAEVPAAVQTAVEGIVTNGGKVDDVDKETTGKTVTFHVEIDRSGAPDLHAVVSLDGKILSQQEEIDD